MKNTTLIVMYKRHRYKKKYKTVQQRQLTSILYFNKNETNYNVLQPTTTTGLEATGFKRAYM